MLSELTRDPQLTLAYAVYGVHFVATRDRSFGSGSIFSFKDCGDENSTRRIQVLKYRGGVIGEVESVVDLVRSYSGGGSLLTFDGKETEYVWR